MEIIADFTNESFIHFFEFNFVMKRKCSFYIQTWQDGDGFLDICDHNSGISDLQLTLFMQRNLISKMNDAAKLLDLIKKYVKVKAFSSKNNKFRLGFNIYIHISDFYFVLCPELNIGYMAKLNLLDKIIPYSKEPWDNKVFGYWEEMDN